MLTLEYFLTSSFFVSQELERQAAEAAAQAEKAEADGQALRIKAAHHTQPPEF